MNPEDIVVSAEILLLEYERQLDQMRAVARELLAKLAEYESSDRLRQIEEYLW
jgi:hypothetical protein